MENNILSIGCIKTYSELPLKSQSTVNDLLQIIKISEKKKDDKEFYIAVLSDSKYMSSFIIPKKVVLKEKDVIQITKLLIINDSNFFALNFSKYEEANTIFGDPIELKTSEVKVNIDKSDKKELKPSNQKPPAPIKVPNRKYQALSHLNTFSRDICILIRATDKSDFKTYINEKGLGSIFNFNVMDKEGTIMQVACFNKIANKYFNIVKEGSVYEIIGGFIKVNNKKYNSTNFDYQLILNESSLIIEVIDEGSIPGVKFNFKKLNTLATLPLHSSIDTVVYVVEVSEKSLVNTRNGEMAIKKVFVADDTEYKVELAVWKKNAELHFDVGDILQVKNATVSEFNGRNISASDSTKITFNPHTRESICLSKWSANFKGTYKTYAPIPREKDNSDFFEEINKDNIQKIDEILNRYEKVSGEETSNFFTIKAMIINLQHSEKNIYQGCPVKKCKKKLTEEETGYSCPSCKTIVKIPAYYMTLSIRLKDCSREQWVDLYGAVAESLLGVTAEDYREIIMTNNQNKLKEISSNLEFQKFFFLVKVKISSFNSILKRKINVYKSEKINFKCESDRISMNLALTFNLSQFNSKFTKVLNGKSIHANSNFKKSEIGSPCSKNLESEEKVPKFLNINSINDSNIDYNLLTEVKEEDPLDN